MNAMSARAKSRKAPATPAATKERLAATTGPSTASGPEELR
jgi:hypothetical protein